MDLDTSHLLEYLAQVEEVAEDILADKQNLIDLDKKRQKTREAIRKLRNEQESKKTWICFGNMFLKLPHKQASTIIEKDFEKIDNEMTDIRIRLKSKVSKLRDMEHKNDIGRFNLSPLSRQEMKSIENLL
ncbi:hypothetical protein ScPMuIL_005135 [Solemya velum]